MLKKNIISIQELNKSYAKKTICKNASFGIHEKEKIGLLGINGCGKSTLLKIFAGKELPDSGNIVFRNNIKISYLPQNPTFNENNTIFEELYYGDNKEFKLLRKYNSLLLEAENKPNSKIQEEINKLYLEIEQNNSWEIEIKAKNFLTQLGLSDISLKLDKLSGGQKRRLDIARVLMEQSDILLLDEPTNHLDIDTIEWLQDYLANYNGIVFFVTHDRFFLDAVCTRIMEIENGVIRFYKGNYSSYLKQKEIEIIDLERKETRKKSQLDRELKWLQRGARARTSKPKNHIERVKKLISTSYLNENKKLNISFEQKKTGKTILELENISKCYDKKNLFPNFNHNFQKLSRIGLIGKNGCGKTTLLNIITEQINPSTGTVKKGLNTFFSYYKQNIDDFNRDISVLEYIQEIAPNIKTKDGKLYSASEMLKRFLFDNKIQQNKINSLSGGEQKRLYLLKSLMFGANFIILDEPTNDLDIKTLEILENYLDSFSGCLLIVSHDRFFLDRICNSLFIFENNKIVKFPGNYSDYLLVKRYRIEESSQKEKIKKPKKIKKGLTYNEKIEIETIESKIENLEKEKQLLEKKIYEEAKTLDYIQFKEISTKQEKIEKELTLLMGRWEELEIKKEE